MHNKVKLLFISAMALAIAFMIIMLNLPNIPQLELTNNKTNQVYATFPLKDGTFSVTFVHSVNKSPVSDIYEVRDGEIYMTSTIYYGFGAGVPDELPEDQKLTFGDNGEMIITDMDLKIDDLVYVVGTVYDHILKINGEEINLKELCGKNSPVKFEIK